MKICDFTNQELRFLVNECNFTQDELALFNLRARNTPLEECADIMNVSVSTIKRINKRLKTKVDKIYTL